MIWEDRTTGANCWGLVRMVLAEQARVELPQYAISGSDYALVSGAITDAEMLPEWICVDPGHHKQFDIVEMTSPIRMGGKMQFASIHLGLFVGDCWVLHTEQTTESRIDPFTYSRLQARITGFWRHHSLNGN